MSPAKTASPSDAAGGIRLVADAGDPMVEIFVIDPDLRLVARSSGRLELDLPPGIYKVKFKAGTLGGSIEDEHLVALEAGRAPPVVQPAEGLGISSPAPIRKTRTTREYHRNPARDISRKTHRQIGSGSRLFVFVRDLDKGRMDNPLRGLTLHAMETDQPLVDLEQAGELICDASSGYRRGEDEISAACSLELAPGSYRLRVSGTPAGDFESAVVASGGWQTQVFLPRRATVSEDGSERVFADLQHASVLMAHPDIGFDPEDPNLRLTEKARYALVERRAALGRGAVERMLEGKFGNPMLGIYGAHILLLARDPDAGLLDVVIKNLRKLVRDHPDLRALELWQAQREGGSLESFRFDSAPMLMPSWHIVRAAAAVREEMVPASSILSRISGWEMCDTMWFTWDADAVARSREKKPLESAAASAVLPAIASMFGAGKQIQEYLDQANLDPLERELLAQVLRALRPAARRPDTGLFDALQDKIPPRIVDSVGYVLAGVGSMEPPAGDVADSVRGRLKSILESDDILKKIGVPKSSVRTGIDRLLGKLSGGEPEKLNSGPARPSYS
jgi:hypothetical protein